jgi:hypothetical protein
MCTTSATNTTGPIYGLNFTPCLQMVNNADLTGKTDVTLTEFTITTNFPNYAEIDAAHGKIFGGEEDDGDETTTPAEDETTAPAEDETTAPAEEQTTVPVGEKNEKPAAGCGAAVTGALALLMLVGAAGLTVCKKKD